MRACLPAFVEKLLRRAGDSRTVQSSLATPADARTVLEVSDRKGVTATPPPCFVLSTRSAVLRVVFETTRRIRFCKTGAVWAVCGHCLEKGARFRIPLPGFDFCFRKTGGFSVLPTCGPLLWGTGSLAIVNAEILQSVKPIHDVRPSEDGRTSLRFVRLRSGVNEEAESDDEQDEHR